MYEEGPGKSGEEKLPSNKKKSQGKAVICYDELEWG